MHCYPLALFAVWLCAASLGAAPSLARSKPPLPPAAPTTGAAVALFTSGVDYTRPDLARKLARDGEGVAIAFDAVDEDPRPFGTDAEVQRLALMLPSPFIAVRMDPAVPESWQRAIAYVRRTPARIVIVPLPERRLGDPMFAAMRAAADVLFIVAADQGGRDSRPSHPDNVVVVGTLAPATATAPAPASNGTDLLLLPPSALREAPGGTDQPPRTSAEAAVLFVGQFHCRARELAGARSPADVRRRLIAVARRDPQAPAPLLEVCAPAAL
jgi:hypothetical protein